MTLYPKEKWSIFLHHSSIGNGEKLSILYHIASRSPGPPRKTLSSMTYQYEALRSPTEIRLLRIRNNRCGDNMFEYAETQQKGSYTRRVNRYNRPIYSIIHIDLNSAPLYEAVSYVWGKQQRSHTIRLVDGQELSVTASVACALPYLAEACRTGYLWIDQITIDQSNIVERSSQVMVMGQIYRRSASCLVWMDTGESLDLECNVDIDWESGNGEEVRKFLREFGGNKSLELSSSAQSTPSSSRFLRLTSSRQHSRVQDHLLWFLEHPWFSRTWVWQEFLLPKKVMFLIGRFEIPLDEISNVFKTGYPWSAAWFETFQRKLNLHPARTILFRKAPGLEFLLAAFQCRVDGTVPIVCDTHCSTFVHYGVLHFTDGLRYMSASHAQDDRDHVYAFFGLAPFLLQHITIDYELSVEEAFATTTKALIKQSKALDFLYLLPSADIGKSKLRLPSWVPDWTVRPSETSIMCHDTLFDAAGAGFGLPLIDSCKHYDRMSTTWNELDVAGKIIDTVLHKLTPFSVYHSTPILDIDPYKSSACLPWEMTTLTRYLDQMVGLGVPDVGEICTKALLRTLFMDGVQWAAITARSSGRSLHRVGPLVIGQWRHHEKIEHVISVLTEQTEPDFEKLPHGATRQLLHELSKIQYRRRVVYCLKGKFALALDHVEKGDKIAILHGARVPFVLRPRPDGKYHLVGQCYYDGAMYGEMSDPDDDNADVFTLV
jgi:hypothetical protein